MDLTSKHGSVSISEERATRRTGEEVVTTYIVTTPTGYRAVLPACLADECLSGHRLSCPMPAEHARAENPANRKHRREYCHRWHAASVERFARDVLATFGAGSRPARRRPVGTRRGLLGVQMQMVCCPGYPDPAGFRGGPREDWSTERVAAALGMTVERYRSELARARE